ncbi:META domain-containing protein [Acinetobacter sp. YH12239]|uniref:META domain-containing protein n=1 Tax=Acinetobacter sp. YH12239 TaxID=2601166 RepID=UPI0015D3370D|nr:META domain-containing protein [Acinetobacter sp. YH12239]
MLKQLLAVSVIGSALLFTACTTTPSAEKQQQALNQLQNKTWILTHIGATEFKTDPTAHNVPSIQFDAASSRLSGADGCNRFMGAYSIKSDKISLSEVATTQMMCVNTQELANRYNAALAKVAAFQVYDKTLRLLDENGNPVLQYESAIQPR